MNYIKITVREKRAKCNGRERIVCGNSDYVIKFDFDDEWAAYDTKTARFVVDGGKYTDVQFTGDEVGVPVLHDTRTVSVGCYAGDIRTTTAALIQAVPCCTDPDGTPADPAPDVYNQLMTRFNTAVRTAEQSFTDAEKAQARKNIGAMDENRGLVPTDYAYTMSTLTGTARLYIEDGSWGELPEDADDQLRQDYNYCLYYMSRTLAPMWASLLKNVLNAYVNLRQHGIVSDRITLYAEDADKTREWVYYYNASKNTIMVRFAGKNVGSFSLVKSATLNLADNSIEYFSSEPLRCNQDEKDGKTNYLYQVNMKSDPTADMQIATKHYVDNEIEAGKEKWELVQELTVAEDVTAVELSPENLSQYRKLLFEYIMNISTAYSGCLTANGRDSTAYAIWWFPYGNNFYHKGQVLIEPSIFPESLSKFGAKVSGWRTFSGNRQEKLDLFTVRNGDGENTFSKYNVNCAAMPYTKLKVWHGGTIMAGSKFAVWGCK